MTSQLSSKWNTRVGFDYKVHKFNFYEIKNPWDDGSAIRQRFAVYWDDFGQDGISYVDDVEDNFQPDIGEGNGQWDPGENYNDFNGDNEWNDYVEPQELAFYWQNKFEVPWMVINAGLRIDGVHYNTKIWADENGNHSYPSDGPTMRVEEGNIKELEISLDSFEEAWLIFAVRDNLDVNNVELNLTLNGINLAPSTSAFENITAVGINSTWSEEIIDNDREDLGYAVKLDNLSEGFWEFRLTLSEQGILVEEATPHKLFSYPEHDYTKMLLSAAPNISKAH